MTTPWLCRIRLISDTRPGILARIAHIFAERGISIDQALAAPHHGKPTVAIIFAASPKMCEFLARRLRRMPEVGDVAIEDGVGRSVWDAPRGEPRTGW